MKAIFCVIFFLITCTTIVAQNVGIGHSTPEAKLTIGHLSSPSSPTLELFENTATGGPRIHFRNAGGTNPWVIVAEIDNAVATNTFLKISYGGIVFPIFTMRGDSKIGIQQANPAYPLDITGDLNLTGAIRVNTNAGSTGQALISNGAAAPTWQSITQNPAIGFSARLNGSVNLTSGISTNLISFVENFEDGGNNFNPATGMYTAPSSGMYAFHMMANFAAPTVGSAAYIVRFLKNGSGFPGNQADIISPARDGFDCGISHTIHLKLFTGETVSLEVIQFSTELLTINGSGGSTNSVFSGYKVY
jgi:hypothetical protein